MQIIRNPAPALVLAALVGWGAVAAAGPQAAPQADPESESRSGTFAPDATAAEVYRAACANCHGADGTGAPPTLVAFQEPLPDFTDCNFATREPDIDWYAVSHGGGPARAFSPMMPAFGQLLSAAELQLALDHVRTLCGDDAWPRGELNLPRALVTEKAYPEDEAVFETDIDTEGDGAVSNQIVYERRFGARNQVEFVFPFAWEEREVDGDSEWEGGLGDVAVGVKRAVWHSLERGGIFSVAAEVILPTGDDEEGFGSGHTTFEPFLAYGQILPANSFFQVQAGAELPFDSDADDEAFARMALGKRLTAGRYGRVWTPMVEVLAARELVSGADTHWDLVPEMQVTLSRRQHVMANLGVRLPLDDTDVRDTRVLFYLLWDWFDGGLFAGWD